MTRTASGFADLIVFAFAFAFVAIVETILPRCKPNGPLSSPVKVNFSGPL